MDRVGWTVRSRDIYKHYLTVHKCCFDRKGFGVTKHHISACNLRQCPKPSPICLGRPITLSDPSYRGEGLKLEKGPRSEGPRDEGEGESLRITRLGRGTRIYSVAEKSIDSDSKIYNFGSPMPTPVAINLTAYLFRFRSLLE